MKPPTDTRACPVLMANGKPVAQKTVQAAMQGEFVNLIEFLPSLDTTCITDNHDVMEQTKPKRSTKNIDSFEVWLQAWNIYEVVVVEHNPTVYSSPSTYRQFIQSCSQKYIWSAVNIYDMHFRLKKSMTRSFEFHSVDSDLFLSVLDATAIKSAKRCFRCKAYDHMVTQKGTNFRTFDRDTQKFYHQGQEICNNWQQDRCQLPSCKRAHVCKAAVEVNLITDANSVINNNSPLINVNNLSVCLAEHPDQSFVNTIIDFAVHGVPIGYTGPREFRECVNWPSARQYRTAVEASIEKDVKKGRKLGPFATHPVRTL